MELIERNHCVFTGKKDLEPLYQFSRFPVFMGCTDEAYETDLFADMNWFISPSSGSVQLNPLIPQEILYAQTHNEVVGDVWAKHHRQFAEFIAKYKADTIFEVGGAHGTLAQNYLKINPAAKWTILDPNPHVAESANIKVIRGFLDSKFNHSGTSGEVLVHSHVFEHLYEPLEFMINLSRTTTVGQLHVFSLPNLVALLGHYYTNALNFEHTCLLSEAYVDILLANHGFEIIEKVYFMDHSIFYATRRIEKSSNASFSGQFEKNKKLFLDFVNYNKNIVEDFNKKIAGIQHPLYLFGAHIFSQFLINFGLNTENVVSILDNGKLKIGKRLYGTRFRVNSPEVLRNVGRVTVILKAGGYNEEIKDKILTEINPNVIFLE